MTEARHLRTFLVVADALNISEAARRLNVTQPALSRQIRELEQAVGHPLFVRHPQGLRLTPAGEALRAKGREAVAAVDGAVEAARSAGQQQALSLSVGYYSNICVWANILGPAFEKLSRTFPKVSTSLTEAPSAQLVAAVAEGRLSLALVGPGEYAPVPGVEIAVACRVPAIVMMPLNHRLAKKRQLALEDLKGEEIVGLTAASSPGRNRALLSACAAAGFKPRLSDVASGVPELMVEVKKRNAVAILDAFASVAPLPGIALVRFKEPALMLEIHTVRSRDSSAAAHRLAELMVAEACRVGRMV